MRHSNDYTVLLTLALLASALFFVKLGTPGLFDADEPAYAGAAREMLERGDWVTRISTASRASTSRSSSTG